MKKLFVPEKITLRKEYLRGFGKQELFQFLVGAAPGLLIAGMFLSAYSSDPGPTLLVFLLAMGYLALCFAVVVRIDDDISMYVYLKRIAHFKKTQKKFAYHAEEAEEEVIFLAEEKSE